MRFLLSLLCLPFLLCLTSCDEIPLLDSKRDQERKEEAAEERGRTEPAEVKVLFFLEGDFAGPALGIGTSAFRPGLRFGANDADYRGGQITASVPRGLPGATLTDGIGTGAWHLIGEGRIRITGTSADYAGPATIDYDRGLIRLDNGLQLIGGGIYPVANPAGLVP